MSERFELLLEKYLERSLSADERREFKALLSGDAELRKQFVSTLVQEAALDAIHRQPVPATTKRHSQPRRIRTRLWAGPRSTPFWYWAGAAACLVLAVSLSLRLGRDSGNRSGPLPTVVRTHQVPPKAAEGVVPSEKSEKTVGEESPELVVPEPRPAPEPKSARVEPPPSPAPQEQPPTRNRTIQSEKTSIAIAKLESVVGQVFVLDKGKRATALPGQELEPGSGVQTGARGSRAVIRYPDSTELRLDSDTAVRRLSGPVPGRSVFVAWGSLDVDVAKQPPDRPMVLSTPHADTESNQARLSIWVGSDGTRLNVYAGRAKFTHRQGTGSVDVLANRFATAGSDPELKKNWTKGDPAKIDGAIDLACSWLLARKELPRTFARGKRHAASEASQSVLELSVLALVSSGSADGDPRLEALVEKMVRKDLGSVYSASLQAMALQKYNPRKYQWRIAQCAQYLVDNQCENGQWDYGSPTGVDHIKPPADPASTMRIQARYAPLQKIQVRARRKGPPDGDNSNSQFAAMGLRACLEAQVDLERSVLEKARDWWIKSQNKDGGWGYNGGGGLEPSPKETQDSVGNASYGSMTAGALSALSTIRYYLKEDYWKDSAVARGLEWMGQNFDSAKNPKKTTRFAWLYFLGATERLGLGLGLERLGSHDWYQEALGTVLDQQKPTGAWTVEDDFSVDSAADTCFAVLFLKRSTPALKPVKVFQGILH